MPDIATEVRVERACDGGVVRIIVDRPRGNVHTMSVMQSLHAAVVEAALSRDIKLITLEGAGAHFSYGASIEEHTPDRIGEVLPWLRRLVLAIAGSPVPVAALVQGICFGGAFEAVAACHFVFAAPDARMALPEVKLGVFPPAACALLPRRAGQSLCDRMVILGEEVTGNQLHTAGFVTRLYPAGELWKGVEAWYHQTLKSLSASSLRYATLASRRQLVKELEEQLLEQEQAYSASGLEDSRRSFVPVPLIETHDANEGINAYLGKRPPVWRNQ